MACSCNPAPPRFSPRIAFRISCRAHRHLPIHFGYRKRKFTAISPEEKSDLYATAQMTKDKIEELLDWLKEEEAS